MTILAVIAKTLKTTEANVEKRIYAMKLGSKCHRCGGFGHYSFNGSHSICYRCNGKGQEIITSKDHPAILEAAKTAVENGDLDKYLAYRQAYAVSKNAKATVMGAWKKTGISAEYDWTKAAEFHRNPNDETAYHRMIADINKKMANAYDMVSKASIAINSKKETYQQDIIDLANMVNSAIETIALAKQELDEKKRG